jgi:hypothetical protein
MHYFFARAFQFLALNTGNRAIPWRKKAANKKQVRPNFAGSVGALHLIPPLRNTPLLRNRSDRLS